MHKGQEVALGGGNVLEHPDFIPLLEKLKTIGVISNITLNQFHFLNNLDLIENLIRNKLIYGIGVSLIYPSKTLINALKQPIFKNVVIHTINGVLNEYDIKELENKGFKLLILGYKHLRRGNEYFEKEKIHILDNQKWLENNILDIFVFTFLYPPLTKLCLNCIILIFAIIILVMVIFLVLFLINLILLV